MSVVDVTKMWSKTGGNYTSEKFDTFANNWTITEAYQVVCEVGTDIKAIRQAVSPITGLAIPQHGTAHPTELGAYVQSIDPERVSPIMWQVTVGYIGSLPDAGDVEIEWSDTSTSEPIDRDVNGRAIVTANCEQIEGLTADIADQVCVIRRRFMSLNTASIAEYRHSTNSDTFLGWPPGTARLVAFQAKNKFKYGTPLEQWDVTARIQFRYPYMGATAEQAWYKRWRHEGLYIRHIVPSPTPGQPPISNTVQRARDMMGQEVTRPVLLKITGEQEPDPTLAVWIYTQVYSSLPYSGLGLL